MWALGSVAVGMVLLVISSSQSSRAKIHTHPLDDSHPSSTHLIEIISTSSAQVRRLRASSVDHPPLVHRTRSQPLPAPFGIRRRALPHATPNGLWRLSISSAPRRAPEKELLLSHNPPLILPAQLHHGRPRRLGRQAVCVHGLRHAPPQLPLARTDSPRLRARIAGEPTRFEGRPPRAEACFSIAARFEFWPASLPLMRFDAGPFSEPRLEV